MTQSQGVDRVIGVLKTFGIVLAGLALSDGPRQLSAQNEIPFLEVVEQRTLTGQGSLEGTGLFSVVRDLVVAESQEVYIVQYRLPEIWVLSGNGIRRSLGRRGSGPGEFRRPSRLGWKEDSLWVADTQLRRITVFPNGKEPAARVFNLEYIVGTGPVVPVAMLVDGTVLVETQNMNMYSLQGGRDTTFLLRIDERGRIADTVSSVVSKPIGVTVDLGARRIQWRHPLPRKTLVAVRSDGEAVWVVNDHPSGRVRIKRMVVGRDEEPRELSVALGQRELDEELARDVMTRERELLREETQRNSGRLSESDRRAILDAIDLPDFAPFTDALVGKRGLLWLRRLAAKPGLAEWLLVDRKGKLLGRLEAPVNWTVLKASEGSLWVEERLGLDASVVRQYSVR